MADRRIHTKDRIDLGGEGRYAIALQERDTFLVYTGEGGSQRNPIHKQLHIEEGGSFALSIKNPQRSSSSPLSPVQRVAFPAPLQERFSTLRFIPANPIELLNYPGAERLMAGTPRLI